MLILKGFEMTKYFLKHEEKQSSGLWEYDK